MTDYISGEKIKKKHKWSAAYSTNLIRLNVRTPFERSFAKQLGNIG